MPYFLGAIDQKSVLAERRLRKLEAALNRLQREAKARERSQSRLTERSLDSVILERLSYQPKDRGKPTTIIERREDV